jgi:hypothetical protein
VKNCYFAIYQIRLKKYKVISNNFKKGILYMKKINLNFKVDINLFKVLNTIARRKNVRIRDLVIESLQDLVKKYNCFEYPITDHVIKFSIDKSEDEKYEISEIYKK